MRHSLRPLALPTLLTALTICSSDAILGGGGGGGIHDFVFAASLNGTARAAGNFTGLVDANTQQAGITGTQSTGHLGRTVDIHLLDFHGADTDPLSDIRTSSYAMVSFVPLPVGSDSGASYPTSDSATGSVVITSFNVHSGSVEGTFHFSTIPSEAPPAGQPDTVGVTGGQFQGEPAE